MRRAVPIPGRCGRAFSLAEMVAVVAIVGVIALIAAPRYASASARYRLEAGVYRFAADLRLARDHAANKGVSVTVALAPGPASSYTIRGLADRDRPSIADTVVKLGESPYRAWFSSISAGGDNSLVFDGFGVPDSSATFVLTGGGISRTVGVDGATGKVTVSP